MCSVSRSAQASASDGVSSTFGSRWRGLAEIVGLAAGPAAARAASVATRATSGRNTTADRDVERGVEIDRDAAGVAIDQREPGSERRRGRAANGERDHARA